MRRTFSLSYLLVAGALGALLAFLGSDSAWAGENNGELKPEALTVAFTKTAFLNVNQTDVEAGYKVLAQTVGRRRGYLVTAKVQVFNDAAEFESLFQDKVVRLIIFELMKELNPQVGEKIQVLTASDPVVDSLVCLRNSGWPPGTFREDLIQTLTEFHLEPAGAQILTLFKTDQLIPFQETQLDTMRKLRATYTRLRKETKP